jgi:hypothetical protein
VRVVGQVVHAHALADRLGERHELDGGERAAERQRGRQHGDAPEGRPAGPDQRHDAEEHRRVHGEVR